LCIPTLIFSLAKLFEKIDEFVVGLEDDPGTEDYEDFGIIPLVRLFAEGFELGGYPEGHIINIGC